MTSLRDAISKKTNPKHHFRNGILKRCHFKENTRNITTHYKPTTYVETRLVARLYIQNNPTRLVAIAGGGDVQLFKKVERLKTICTLLNV